MSNRDRNTRKSGVSDSNRHNKYHTNKWKNNWGRNFNNYGNSNYRNTDYGPGHSDNRYNNNWNQTLPNPWDTDWFNNQQHPNFTNSHYNASNFNITPGLGVNFTRTNRLKNLKEKPDRSSDRNFTPKPQSEPNTSHLQSLDKNQKKIVKCNRDTPSTVTSSSTTTSTTVQPFSSNVEPCSSNSIEGVTVVDTSNTAKQHEQHSAEQVTKKLIHQLTSMNKHSLKQMINNPSSKYETALQTHARNRMRAEMRTKLQSMSSNQENQLVNNVLDTEESVDMDKIPDNVFDEIGRVLDINLLGQEGNSNKKYNDSDDKDKEQIAYPEDLFLRAEKLLMENSILFLEDRLNDSMLNGDRLEDDRTPVKIKNEIKEEPDDIGDDNFFEIQESANDTFLLNDLVFEDREGSMPSRNDNFAEQLSEMADKDESIAENHRAEDESRLESVRITVPLVVKEEIDDIIDQYEQSTNNNVKDISPDIRSKNSIQPSPTLYKSPDKQGSTQCSTSTSNHKTITSDDFKALVVNVKHEFNRDTVSNSPTIHQINPYAICTSSQEPPKKTDLFTKLQNSGAFEHSSAIRRPDPTDYKRENVYSRKKKKKHKSRSRSISRLRSRSRSSSRSRNSRKSKKSSRDRSRRRDTSQCGMPNDTTDPTNPNQITNIEFYNDSSIQPTDDEFSNKFGDSAEPVTQNDDDKTDPSVPIACTDELTNTKTVETQPDEKATDCERVEAATEPDLNNQNEFRSNFLDGQCVGQSTGSPVLTDDFTNMSKGIGFNSDDQPKAAEPNSISDIVTEEGAKTVKDAITKSVEEAVPEATEKVNGDAAETITETDTEIVDNAVKETIEKIVVDPLNDIVLHKIDKTVTESVKEESPLIICETDQENVLDIVPDTGSQFSKLPTLNVSNEENNQMLDSTKTLATELIRVESTPIGSNSVELSTALNSEPSMPDGGAVESNQPEKTNIVAIKKIVLKPSSSRHQKSTSKHKCDKDRHAPSSHKAKKSETSSQSSKRSDHKDNSSSSSSKHSHHEQPHRVWRSAGEKKCIEPSTKSTLRSIDIFDPSRPVEPLKVIEPAKPVESKSSSPRKERGKSQSRTAIKSPVSQSRSEPKKNQSLPTKKVVNQIAMKEKISPVHRHHSTADSNSKSSSTIAESTMVNLAASSLSDSLKIVTDSYAVLQRMKDIDLRIMEMHVKRTVIDDKIINLNKEKTDIDQATMQLNHERFSLLSSLLANSAIGQKKACELSREKSNVEPKVVDLSSDDEVLTVGTVGTTKKMSSKSISINTSHNSKRKIDDDAKADGIDGTKCKKLKINLNPLKPLANNKSNARNYVDVDEVQSDLKTKMINATRRCTVRLTKLSAKKIKLLMGKAETEPDDGCDASGSARLKSNFNCLHKMIFDGSFRGHRLPIVHLQVIDGFLIAASEDSNLYMHDLASGKLIGTFTEHIKTVTNFIATETNHIYSVSLDGCLKKLSLKKFDEQLLSISVGEALQVMDYSWDTAFIGSRSGKIYILNTKTDTFADECLCSVGKSIMALKATKEGPRKILIASSRCHNISVRDAISGLLLRTIEVPDKLTIYSILLDGGQLYCGTNKNLVFRYEFTSGVEISRIKLGTGTICLKSYKNSLILGGCYDGYIYAYDTKNEIQLSRFPGPGKMLLHFDVFKDNIIAAAKDKSLSILEVPHDIVSHE